MALSHRGAIVGPGWVPNIYRPVYSGGATVLAPQAGGRVVAQRNGVRAWRSMGGLPTTVVSNGGWSRAVVDPSRAVDG